MDGDAQLLGKFVVVRLCWSSIEIILDRKITFDWKITFDRKITLSTSCTPKPHLVDVVEQAAARELDLAQTQVDGDRLRDVQEPATRGNSYK